MKKKPQGQTIHTRRKEKIFNERLKHFFDVTHADCEILTKYREDWEFLQQKRKKTHSSPMAGWEETHHRQVRTYIRRREKEEKRRRRAAVEMAAAFNVAVLETKNIFTSKLAAAINRKQLSRKATYQLVQATTSFYHDVKEYKINRESIHRQREKIRILTARLLKSKFQGAGMQNLRKILRHENMSTAYLFPGMPKLLSDLT